MSDMPRGSHPFDPEKLKSVREQRGLSMAQLAADVGCTKAQVAAYEAGRVPEPERLGALARQLDVPTLHLMGVAAKHATLQDLRVAAGMTADDMARTLTISRNTYRSIENNGRFPHGRESYIRALSDALALPRPAVLRAISRTPLVRARTVAVNRIAHDVDRVLWTPREEAYLEPDDLRLQVLHHLTDHPAETLRRLVNFHLARGREHIIGRFAAQAYAQFAQDTDARDAHTRLFGRASESLEEWPRVLVRSIDWLADALTSREWRNLCRLARSEHYATSPGLPPGDEASVLVGRPLLDCPAADVTVHAPPHTRTVVRIHADNSSRVRLRMTPWGWLYTRASAPLYSALYPQVPIERSVFDPPQPRMRTRMAAR